MLKIKLLLLLYKVTTTIIAPIIALFQFCRRKKPPYGHRAWEFLGVVPKIDYHKPLWFHTVSVGESMGAIPLIRTLATENPSLNIVVTTATTTARELYRKMPENVTHLYVPLDSVCAVKRFINRVKPRGLIIMETELWPNLLSALHQKNIPCILINARLSQRSTARYHKLGALFTVAVGQHLTHICCQSKQDAANFASLNLAPQIIETTGSLKFDVKMDQQYQGESAQFTRLIKGRPVLAVASTHEGEEEQVLSIYQQIKKELPELLLIIIPRHPERFAHVFQLCRAKGFKTSRRSQNDLTPQSDILLGDSMGELPFYFGCATLVLMGGSLVDIGGHNPLEAIACNRPVVSGPFVRNFKKIYADLEKEEASLCIELDELPAKLLELLKDQELRNQMCHRATSFLEANSGATAKTLATIKKFIKLD